MQSEVLLTVGDHLWTSKNEYLHTTAKMEDEMDPSLRKSLARLRAASRRR